LKKIKLIDGWRQETEFFYKENRDGRQELIKKKLVLFLAKVSADKSITLLNKPAKNEVLNGYAWLDFKIACKYLRFKNLKQIITEANSFILKRIQDYQNQKKKGGDPSTKAQIK